VDVTCAHCAEPWDVYDLAHDSWAYLRLDGSISGVPSSIEALVSDAYTAPENGPRSAAQRGAVAAWVHRRVLSGAGCPCCGFDHHHIGPYRMRQLHELVIDGVSDEDPALFI